MGTHQRRWAALLAVCVWLCFAVSAFGQYEPRALPASNPRSSATEIAAAVQAILARSAPALEKSVPDPAIRAQHVAYITTSLTEILFGYYRGVPPSTFSLYDRMPERPPFAARSKDPLFLAMRALENSNRVELERPVKQLDEALDLLVKSEYPRALIIPVAFEAARRDKDGGGRQFDVGLGALLAAMAVPDLTDPERRFIATVTVPFIVHDAFDISRLRRLRRSVETAGGDAWLQHLLIGQLHLMEAWEARGGELAVFVTPEGWEGFREHLKLAYKQFNDAWELNPHLPEPACAMIRVAMGQGDEGDPARFWFDRAVACEFDFRAAYEAYQLSLEPKWGGSEEELLEFAHECAKTNRYDTSVPMYYVYIIRAIGAYSDDYAGAWTLPGVWETASRILEGRIAHVRTERDDGSPGFYATIYAGVAYWNRRWPVGDESVLSTFDMTHNSLQTEAMEWMHVSAADLMMNRARFEGGESSPAARAARALVKKDWDGAVRIVDEALAAPDSISDRARAALLDTRFTADWNRRLAAGEAGDLSADDLLSGWRPSDAQWLARDGGITTGKLRDKQPRITLAGDLPSNFHIKFRLHITRSDGRPIPFRVAVLLFLNPGVADDPQVEVAFHPNGPRVELSTPFEDVIASTPVDRWSDRTRDVDLLVWGPNVTVRLDGRLVMRKDVRTLIDTYGWFPGNRLAFATSWTHANTPVTISNVQLLPLTKRPPMSFLESVFPGVYELARVMGVID